MTSVSPSSPEKIPESHAAHERSRSVESPKVAKFKGREYEIIAKEINVIRQIIQIIMNGLSLKGFATDREILIKDKLATWDNDLKRAYTHQKEDVTAITQTALTSLVTLHKMIKEIDEGALIMEQYARKEVEPLDIHIDTIKEIIRIEASTKLTGMTKSMKKLLDSVLSHQKYQRVDLDERFTKDELHELMTLNNTLTPKNMKVETINQAVNTIRNAFERNNKLQLEESDLEIMQKMDEFLPQLEEAAQPVERRETTKPRPKTKLKTEQKEELPVLEKIKGNYPPGKLPPKPGTQPKEKGIK